MENTGTGLLKQPKSAAKLQETSLALNIKPEKLLAKIEKNLPGSVEQAIYLKHALDFNLRPEDCAKMLEMITYGVSLREGDDEDVEVGENLVVNLASNIEKQLVLALQINGEDFREESYFELTKPIATALVMLFDEHAELILKDLVENVDEIRYVFKTPNGEKKRDREALRKGVIAVIRTAWQVLDDGNEFVPMQVHEFLSLWEAMDKEERKLITEDIGWEVMRERFDV